MALLGTALYRLGHWGGHEHRAGGKIRGIAHDGRTPGSMYETLKERWLSA